MGDRFIYCQPTGIILSIFNQWGIILHIVNQLGIILNVVNQWGSFLMLSTNGDHFKYCQLLPATHSSNGDYFKHCQWHFTWMDDSYVLSKHFSFKPGNVFILHSFKVFWFNMLKQFSFLKPSYICMVLHKMEIHDGASIEYKL